MLHVRGRDVARQDRAVRFDAALGTWTLVGEAQARVISPQRQAVLEVLCQANRPMSPQEIGHILGRQDEKAMGALYVILHAMREAGEIDAPARGRYMAKIAKNQNGAQDLKSLRMLRILRSTRTLKKSEASKTFPALRRPYLAA